MRVAVLDDYQGVAPEMADWDALPAGSEVEFLREHLPDEGARAERLAKFDVIVAMRERTPFPRSLIERLPGLRLLVTTGARNAAIDVRAANERGIVVCGTRGIPSPTAELTWGLIFALLRHIPAEDWSMHDRGWQSTIGRTVAGRTLGVLGLGNLGSRVAKVGRAFEMEVVAWSQNLTVERAEAVGARLVTKDELLSRADIVTIHLVLSDRTRGLIGERELGLMRPDACLVNTSRGPIIDEGALVKALETRQIAGAALDVYDEEPLPADHPLRLLSNVVLTPHLGYVTEEGYRVFYADAVEDILRFLAGDPVRVVGG